MRASSPAQIKEHNFLRETREGFSYIVSRPVIFGLTIMEGFASVFGLDHAMLTILASDVFRVGAHGFGFMPSARGLGAVIGSRLFIAMGQRPEQGKILLASAILYGLGFALFGLSPSFTLSLFLLPWSAPPISRGALLATRSCRCSRRRNFAAG